MSVQDRVTSFFDRGGTERTLEEKEELLGYALILPSILLVSVIILYPLAYNVYLSFHEVPLAPGESALFVGTQHYADLLSDPAFWEALYNTVVFTFFSDLLATAGGLFAALLLNRAFRGRRLVRGLMLLPYVAPIIAVAFAWRWMLDPLFGIVPFILNNIFNLNLGTIDLLGNSDSAIWTVIIFDAWRYFPFAFLMLIARVQAIPEEMYEAARIDGASRFAQFKDITLPELKYILATVFLLRWIWNFNKFADVWLLTREVETLPIFTYQTAFANFELGLGAAISMVLFVFLISFVLIYVNTVLEW
ncbi:sugar ABC transporter permease [Halorubrum ezzemoulense]|uniref:carbohydrate ABC transporter permease n=1 Tax=Halorubrum ezzemoulense TaxID=337243 RepID=UPI00232DD60F|nr:sugar ABC transporter permease [Halorubrum ezzemoulense]MDB2265597.1 sugar ABC transporter permease [Halorubrum ezzemoulense]MDB9302622.1 sugar ABC transporter permease [Halorubrum ezzemoulense]